MKRALLYILVVVFLQGCANLAVKNVTLVWTEDVKKVTAEVENLAAWIPMFSRPAENFAVAFDAFERWASPGGTPQISLSISYLDTYDSIAVEADFAPLANSSNYDLWNVDRIRVTADPDGVVPEGTLFRSNNIKNVPVPFSSDLPIVVVDTSGTTVPDEPKIAAQMKIIAAVRTVTLTHGTYEILAGRNFLSDPPNNYDGRIAIEARGASSQNFCQRQYGFETRDDSDFNNDRNVSLLKFPTEEDWVLHAPYADKSLIRNYVAYKTSNLIGRYASRTKFVEAFINDPGLVRSGCPTPPPDHYAGVYILMEKIKRDPNRVAVERLTASDNAEPQITGGYILKIDWFDVGDVVFNTPSGTRITHVYPRASTNPAENEITVQQSQWIRDYVLAFEAALNSPSFADPVNGYAKYIDVDSFVDYFILNELFKNYDAFRASTYMHKPRNQKLKMGPVWDFNLSMGNAFDLPHGQSSGWILGTVSGQPFWWRRLLQDTNFAQKLADRWQVLRAGPLVVQNLKTMIDTGATELAYAQARHFNRWPILGVQVFNVPPPPNETFATNIQNLKTWIEARAIWIDQNILLPIP